MAVKLVASDIVFGYQREREVLHGVNLSLHSGEVMSLVGPNGSGKSTLLKCLNRLINFNNGRVTVDGADLRQLSLRQLSQRMAYVPQSARNIFPFSVFDVVLMGRRPHVSWRVGPADRHKVATLIHTLKLSHLAERQLGELSGGEQQKVLLARALAQEPEILLLDEPTASLDIQHQLEVMKMVHALSREQNISVLMALHDLNLAARFSDTVLMLRQGRVFANGVPSDIINPDNILRVYGVEAVVTVDNGHPYIIPREPVAGDW
jgi:iron complex transport system ATP-binding protein